MATDLREMKELRTDRLYRLMACRGRVDAAGLLIAALDDCDETERVKWGDCQVEIVGFKAFAVWRLDRLIALAWAM